jgi:hypothetical protein
MNNDNNQYYLWGGVIVIIIIIVLAFWAFSGTAPSGTATTTATGATTGNGSLQPPSTKVAVTNIPSSTIVNPYIRKDATNVYIYADTNPSGVDEYSIVPDANPASFVALTASVVVEQPTQANGTAPATSLGQGSVAYYKDKNRIYIFSFFKSGTDVKTGMEVIQDADPATFRVLNTEYTKDKNAVYALQVPSDTDPHPTGSYTWHAYDAHVLTDTDPASFVVVSSASLNYDAHDKSHTYRGGLLVGNYP